MTRHTPSLSPISRKDARNWYVHPDVLGQKSRMDGNFRTMLLREFRVIRALALDLLLPRQGATGDEGAESDGARLVNLAKCWAGRSKKGSDLQARSISAPLDRKHKLQTGFFNTFGRYRPFVVSDCAAAAQLHRTGHSLRPRTAAGRELTNCGQTGPTPHQNKCPHPGDVGESPPPSYM